MQNKRETMKLLGITGGSGCGKTTVSDVFRRHGVYVADADLAARTVVQKGQPALEEIERYFGKDVLLPGGELDRRRLGSIVFADASALNALNRITHKYITKIIFQELSEAQGELAAIDGAVLIESGIAEKCDALCVVSAWADIRTARIMRRDGLSREEAEKRIAAQRTDEFYRQHADFILDNNGDAEQLECEVIKIIKQLTN